MKFTSLLAAALLAGSALSQGNSEPAGAVIPADVAAAAAALGPNKPSQGDKVQFPITSTNSRGAGAIKPQFIATVVIDKLSNVISSVPVSLPIPKLPIGFKKREPLLGGLFGGGSGGASSSTPSSTPSSTSSSTSSSAPSSATGALVERMPTLRFPYTSSSVKVRGVSLGGWLVIENFITPSIYASTGNKNIIDEWTFGSLQPRSQAVSILQKHLNTFISEDDIRQIAAAGLNHVRIPIGYWAFEVGPGEPFLKLNQWDLLKQAVQLCGKYGLKVLVDLHAAPGNQNGFEHGGRTGYKDWAGNATNVQRTIDILQTMSREFSQSKYANSVTAIELLNEPVTDQTVVLDFSARAYEVVRFPNGRDKPESPLLVVISDSFISPADSDYWTNKARPPNYEGVAIDSHVYTIFSAEGVALSATDRINYYCSLKPKWAIANQYHPQIIGEWTPAFTDCATGLNGRNTGSRFDGTFSSTTGYWADCYSRGGDGSTFTANYKKVLGSMWEAQVDANEGGAGWMMWTWKTEPRAAEEWSYQKGLQYGWIPRDPTQRPNGVRC
ncbi:related to EXG1-Exo-1,3-beta-glucanase precursor [Sporisorium reilianum f. sp. reilianum]|uniref:Related to EXG1-Exo-1,3-beta-glucanase n=1 Tax=Sporisorium reilianum f. sp. reilianum TaxID=72559 RepID=A0A2N8UIZ1_9BASI|nr:related to EXG1-Exo-1,3-beta-glucanase precursor [Sporisorium reilianum f. sp. reilianum]